MYCDKPNVNQLTALLCLHDIRHVVVCPGSRNAVLSHNFHECPKLACHPVTDERSAAFAALGLCLSTRRPAAVCVTSGSALLNTLPAVAEAAARGLPLLVISADRPAQWLGQLDGQTLPQNGALLPYAPSFQLPEPKGEEEERWCNRLVNEALLRLTGAMPGPVHVNVPVSEPLYSFSTPELPRERVVREVRSLLQARLPDDLLERFRRSSLPLLVTGQRLPERSPSAKQLDDENRLLALPELIANRSGAWRSSLLEALLPSLELHPDIVVHSGGNLVGKQLKLLLRKEPGCAVVRIEEGNGLPDTFSRLETVVRSEENFVLSQLVSALPPNPRVATLKQRLSAVKQRLSAYVPACFSDIGVMQLTARRFAPEHTTLHLGNSSVVRNAGFFFDGGACAIHCNRGLNGIEGSLSTAVGSSLPDPRLTLVLIGDLSFFYDQNALWNQALNPRLRILLFNNGGGQIFYQLPGTSQMPALREYVAAAHHTTARGIAESNGLSYLSANGYAETEKALDLLLAPKAGHPALLEVFTRPEDNLRERTALLAFIREAYQHATTL